LAFGFEKMGSVLENNGYLKVKSCQKMAEFLKITNYKIQITNKFQITMSEIANSRGEKFFAPT
jgi:hypothetical protein